MVKALIYNSQPLPRDAQFRHGYQWTILGISLASLFLPLLYYVFVFVQFKWKQYRARPVKIKVVADDNLFKLLEHVTNTPYFESDASARLSEVSSYARCQAQEVVTLQDTSSVDLLGIPIDAMTTFTDTSSSVVLAYCAAPAETVTKQASRKRDRGIVKIMETIHSRFSTANCFQGVILPLSDGFTPRAWSTLFQHLKSLNLLVFVEIVPPYTDLAGINLSLCHGVIIRNATILENGSRRDFFRGFELRDVLARCAKQRSTRPTFTTVLHDPCELPSTPTLRRAYKFARFHEVILSVCSLIAIQKDLPQPEPLSAFDWLKRLDVLDLHREWNEGVVDQRTTSNIDLTALEPVLPGITATFVTAETLPTASERLGVEMYAPEWTHSFPTRASYFTTGEAGQLLTTQACYDLREQITDVHVASVLRTQAHMRELDLLQEFTIYEKQEVFDRLNPFLQSPQTLEALDDNELMLITQLVEFLKDDRCRVFRGLDTGFTLPENRFHLWSVSEWKDEVLYLYISLMAKDLVATLLHTFLILHDVPRQRCFEIELVLASSENINQGLPPRVVSELRDSTYAELLTHLHQMRLSRDADCFILRNVEQFARHLLVEETTRTAWKKIHGADFLAEDITVEALYQYRLDWLARKGITQLPLLSALIRMHRIAEHNIVRALRNGDLAAIDLITKVLCESYSGGATEISIEQDLVGLMVFCIFRKYGVEETYIESSDRCPVYHFQTDQPGVFSELWVIGSQCEVYFDVTPGILGAMHYKRYRAYLAENPPPADAWNGQDVFTAYHKVDNPTPEGMLPGDAKVKNPFQAKDAIFFPRIQKFAFLSVFCLPAVCDVMLLVFLGRGVFQTAFMTGDEIAYSTLGLLTALLLCSGTIAWIGSSGGYYLYNAAFDSLNHVMVQKLSGAFCLTLAVGVLGGFGIGAQRGWYPGLVFFLYLMGLSTYLNILGILATMHRDGSPLPSGRSTLWKSLPVLLISPVVTTFVHGHDLIIYLVVIYTFLTVLYWNYRLLCAEWSQFYTKIILIDDKQVLDWHKSRRGEKSDFDYETARQELESAVQHSRAQLLHASHRKEDSNQLVTKLAPGIEYSRWLLKKDAGPGASVPAPYSSAWNNQLKVSLNTYQNFVRGLKEHSAFLQYRYAKNDIGYNVVMFIATLLDRWVSITMSAAGDGPLNLYADPRNRFTIAFALSYFLTSAVALDYQLQFCWTAVIATSSRSIESQGNLDTEEQHENGRKSRLYWSSLRDLFTIVLMLFGFWSLMLVFWVDEVLQLETFFAYAASYTCVLWFQFNRVFIKDGTKAFLITVGAIALGFSTGVVLHLIPSTYNFHFIDIIAMATCTVTAAMGSFLAADFSSDRDEVEDDLHSPQELMNKTGWKTHSQKFVGLDWNETQRLKTALGELKLSTDPQKSLEVTKERYPELASSIVGALNNASPSQDICAAFPHWRQILSSTLERWTHGTTRIFLISAEDLLKHGINQVSAVGRMTKDDDILEVYVPLAVNTDAWILANHESMAQLISEAVLHETCELVFKMQHSDAVCAEMILSTEKLSFHPRRMTQQIYACTGVAEATKIILSTSAEVIKHSSLGFRVNTEWTHLPEDLRLFIIARILGLRYKPSILSTNYLEQRCAGDTKWEEVVARSNAKLWLTLSIYSTCKAALETDNMPATQPQLTSYVLGSSYLTKSNDLGQRIYYGLFSFFQYIAVISNGETDLPREFVYSTRASSFRGVYRGFVLSIWQLCAFFRRFSVELTLLHSRPELQEILVYCRKGVARSLYDDRIVVSDPFKPLTGFKATVETTDIMRIYPGRLTTEPEDGTKQAAYGYYDEQRRLIRLETKAKGEVSDIATYEYDNISDRLPRCRTNQVGNSYYDENGRITHGTFLRNEKEWSFSYDFTSDVDRADVIRANYTSTGLNVAVFWCMPQTSNGTTEDIQSWLPCAKVSKTIHSKDNKQWVTQYTYRHKRDPTIVCTIVDGENRVEYPETTPDWITKDKDNLMIKPLVLHFDAEDLLFRHDPAPPWWRRALRRCTRNPSRVCYSPMHTGALRTMLWDRWHKSKSLDGVTACYVDTQIVRHEKLLGPYWKARDFGRLRRAAQYLDDHIEAIVARIEIEDSVSQNTFLPYKMADLYTMGTGGSANVKTRKFEDNYSDTHDRLSVMFLDTGCFPDQPGGVSNCRRDLVNGHVTIRNHVFTESANDFGVPRYQVDKNVQSIKVLPLWGLDYLSPYHGLFDNLLDSQVTFREHHTSEMDIKNLFLPILRRLVRGARSQSYSQADLVELTQTFIDLSVYFEEKDYLKTWKSNQVKRTWRECWLEDTPNTVSTSTYHKLELPTMAQMDEAMELWLRYFFVFSVRIPEVVPTVFQCTHHGVGSIFGMLLKLRRGTTYMIWDHAIYWRESCLNVSSSQCILSLSVQNMLLGAIKMASNLCYNHADVILPCTNLFNPGWEADIGSDQGRRQHKVGFARKIDPVVNGISEMERFEPVDKIRSENPTVMMLSNVQFIKDVKNAVFSADIIVNRFKFKKYRLVIYGAMDRTPQYTAETEAIIKTRGLEENVKLAGFGNPKEILKDAWAFMNSSLSEGLPLAIGEAALSGCPVIATDVGATALVISDPKDPKIRYGEIVPPNDSVALARAQIQILAMLGPWAKYCGDSPPPMPENFTKEDVDRITQRMYDKTEERRALGRKGRETVLHSFNGNRYLREHEQMYWLGSYRSQQRADHALQLISQDYIKFDETLAIDPVIATRESKLWEEAPWREFRNKDGVYGRTKTQLTTLLRRRPRDKQKGKASEDHELDYLRRVSILPGFSEDGFDDLEEGMAATKAAAKKKYQMEHSVGTSQSAENKSNDYGHKRDD
ncbi:protein of unknown function [Taphrina deformans PYCC 5710]|uniref:DUF3492 domain-containing protein n=1 Tax=Taphrina deformans (strain PYCC 5710 / ATCC 11124 / CBS 356.35 / IMI 108563 / JCM 9778 / NBRC 8474) TaxID=1097556 RepID=R4XGG7_TAPDE|nr:protein of unknown function [Taphrina deformans PYCC 5710]|eukprot:CCG84862.1 protein of unknown function [Taphrina deformans PYCC 5710]